MQRLSVFRKLYSSGPSTSQIYQKFKEFDLKLQKLKVDKLEDRELHYLHYKNLIPLETRDHFLKLNKEAIEGKKQSMYWYRIFKFIGIPCIILTAINAYLEESGHEEKSEYIPYHYLNIKRKPFPWGEHTLFWNPKHNPE